jgi:linoleoyl-CoA desaturase
MTLFWVLLKDYFRFAKYDKEGLIKQVNGSKTKELIILIFTKVWILVYSFGLPLIFTDFSFGQIVLGFLTAHLIAGFLLALVFQPAHVSDETAFVAIPENGELPYSFAEHQIRTTRNFANENRLFSWYAGGLNYQIEHHLFPHICHIHYRKIAPIVRKTAEEFGLPYENTPTVWEALVTHGRHLRNLGRITQIPQESVVQTATMAHA